MVIAVTLALAAVASAAELGRAGAASTRPDHMPAVPLSWPGGGNVLSPVLLRSAEDTGTSVISSGTRASGWSVPSTTVAKSEAPNFEPSACPVEFPAELTVDCGVVTVPNNRAAHGHVDRNGSVDRLPVAVIRAQTPNPKPDPIVYVTGGPSFNVFVDSFSAEFFSGLPFAQDRDFILYNQRGVGFAQPRLGCPEFDAARADAFPHDPTPDQYLDAVRACRQRLVAEGIDLSAYNVAEDAADLDDIRQALGYEQWNLYVLSAGGPAGLTAMRLYPQGIRSVIFDSPFSNLIKLRGPDFAAALNRTLEMVFSGCAANPACQTAYPNLRARFYDAVHALRRDPFVFDLPVEGGTTVRATVDGDGVLVDAAVCSGDPFCAQDLPGVLDTIAEGDVADVYPGEDVLTPEEPLDLFVSEGKTGVEWCHDLIAFEPNSELQRAARELPEWRAYLLTLRFNYVPTQTKEACKVWRAGRAKRAQHRPVISDIPTLMLAGEWDNIASPVLQQRITRTLSNSFYVEFPGTAHWTLGFDHFALGNDCPAEIFAAFVDAPMSAPDTSCTASLPEVDFTP
jgi:pimeloyl-ACP methyl ester carboxylesterase